MKIYKVNKYHDIALYPANSIEDGWHPAPSGLPDTFDESDIINTYNGHPVIVVDGVHVFPIEYEVIDRGATK